ncbi:hypothetical protein AAU61_13240 [Desulfocarbo indianensis]|nr:hypothetical protein AAU61_13240 [Desulfocarbo indianensis]
MNAAISKSAQPDAQIQQGTTENAAPQRPRPRLPGNQQLLGMRREWRGQEAGVLAYRQAQRLGLQAKLQVGSSDDPFEREADRVAERVMRMRADEDEEPATLVAGAGPRIQRAGCEPCTPDEDESQLRRKSGGSQDGGGRLPLSEEALNRGGAPLPGAVRAFFEPRLGRDLAAVRLHSGPEADSLNQGLNSFAFTYGSHVWLGHGQQAASDSLLAHELAHVVQQTSPRVLRKEQGAQAGPAAVRGRDTSGALRRSFASIPYFEPYSRSGTWAHSQVLPTLRMTDGTGLFTEAPVPNADEHGSDFGKIGRADMYAATAQAGSNQATSVGLFFRAHLVPRYLRKPAGMRLNGGAYDHRNNAAPRYEDAQREVVNTSNAPSRVRVGDLKPIGERAFMGRSQLSNYQEGFRMAHREVGDLSPEVRDGSWTVFSAGLLQPDDIAIPSQYQPPYTGQTPQNLVLKEAGIEDVFSSRVAWNPPTPIPGHLGVRHDPDNPGIWIYYWAPSSASGFGATQLPGDVRALGARVQDALVDPLTHSPLQPQTKRRPGTPPVISRDRSKILRRRIPDRVAESFNYQNWNRSLREMTRQFGRRNDQDDLQQARGRLRAIEALELLHRRTGMTTGLPRVPTGTRDDSRLLRKLDFWTGNSARPFGLMRRVFGRAFVSVARFYIRVRDRFRERLQRRRRRLTVGRGFIGAALTTAYNTAKMAIRFLIGRVADRLWDSLTTGVERKLRSLIPDEINEQIEERVREIRELQGRLERSAVHNVENMIREVVGPYEDEIQQLEEIQRVVSDITTIINLVRWGARVIACLSPPGWGCLWLLGEAALDQALALLVETCWFQRHITPYIANTDFMRRIPNSIAQIIVEKVRTVMPESMRDIFADVPTISATVRPEDIECNDDSEATRLNDERRAMFNMQRRLGEDRFRALGEMARATGVGAREPLSAAEISRLTAAIESSGITASQLRAYARQYPDAPEGVPSDFTTSFSQTVQPHLPGGAAAGQADAPAQATPPVPEGENQLGIETAPPAAPPPSGSETTATGSGPGIRAVRAQDRVLEEETHGEVPDTYARVINGSLRHTRGDVVSLDMVEFHHDQAILLMTGIPAMVTRRYFLPEGSNADTATDMFIRYRLMQSIRFQTGGIVEGEPLVAIVPWGRHGLSSY